MSAKTEPAEAPQGSPEDENNREIACEEAVAHIGMGKTQVMMVVAIGLLWMADSMEILLLSFIGPGVKCEWNLRAVDESILTMVVFLGMLAGALFWGKVSDRYGRKLASFGTALFSFVFGAACALAPSFEILALTRCAVGVAVGGVSIAFSYLMEFIPSQKRGPLSILFCTFWSLGAIFEALLAWVVMSNGLGWRWLVALSSVPMALSSLFILCIPESPQYLLAVGKRDECQGLLERLARRNNRTLPGLVALPEQTDKPGKLSDLVSPGIAKFTIMQWIIWGVSGFTYYGVVLLTTQLFALEDEGKRCAYSQRDQGEDAACEGLSADTYADVFVAASGELPGLLVTAWLVHRIGRRGPMSVGCLIEAACCIALVPCWGRQFENMVLFVLRAIVVSVFQVAYLYTGEAYPTSVKGVALGTCSSAARIGGMLTPYVANALMAVSTEFGLFVYGSSAAVCALVTWLLPFDTRGHPMPGSLEELRLRISMWRGRRRRWFARVAGLGGSSRARVGDNTPLNKASESAGASQP